MEAAMSVYLIRASETKKLHGIVWGSLDQIWDVVDEIEEPEFFEYAKLKPGGLISPTGIDPAKTSETRFSEIPPLPNGGFLPADLDPSERTFDALFDPDDLRWRRFDDTLGKHGMVSRIMATIDAHNGDIP